MSNILNEFLSKFRNFDTEDLYNYCIHKGFNTWFVVVEKIACNTRFLQHFCLSIIVSYLYRKLLMTLLMYVYIRKGSSVLCHCVMNAEYKSFYATP